MKHIVFKKKNHNTGFLLLLTVVGILNAVVGMLNAVVFAQIITICISK